MKNRHDYEIPGGCPVCKFHLDEDDAVICSLCSEQVHPGCLVDEWCKNCDESEDE